MPNLFDSIDLDKVATPEDEELIRRLLAEGRQERNTMTEREFREYIPIFKLDGAEKIGAAKFETLFKSWYNRVSVYDPVVIVSDTDPDVIIMTLPPIFNRVKSINSIPQAADIVNAFYNVNNMEDDISNKRAPWTNLFIKAFNYAQDKMELANQKAMSDELAKAVISKTNEPTPSHTEVELLNEEQITENSMDMFAGDGDVETL